MAKKQYYDISNILKTNASYMMLLGQRANGKSYQAKKVVLEDAYHHDKLFIYLRRWERDIKQDYVTEYFSDMPIKEITNGVYVGVLAYQGYIYFYSLDDDNKIVKGKTIGRYLALNLNERYKSQVFKGYEYLIYEEFITDKLYLDNEPRTLMQLVSTIFRDRKGTVFLVGNTLSRVCPYFSEWSLTGTLKQKPGTIEVYHYHVEDDVIDVAVEYCANSNKTNTMFFGQASKQIISGEWDTEDLPHLPGDQKDYECVYKVLVKYQSFNFIMNLLIDEDGSKIVFIYPHTGKTKVDRIIQDEFSTNPMINNRLNPRHKPESHMLDCFRFNKVCYSDNLTGTDFGHVIEHFRII